MPEICSPEDIPLHNTLTVEQIRAFITKIDITIYNIFAGNGTYGGMDIREGDHSSNPTQLMAELRRQRQQYVEMLKDPQLMGDMGFVVSQWDNPDLPLGGILVSDY